jgi:CBS domain containing-hemolysin-like protein
MILAAVVTARDWGVLVAILVMLLILSGLALAETSVSRMSPQRAQGLLETGHRGAATLVRLSQQPEKWVNTLLLAVNVLQTLQAVLTGILASRLFGTVGVAAGLVLNVFVFFVLTESIPKTCALIYPNRSALLSAPLIAVLMRIRPLTLCARFMLNITALVTRNRGSDSNPEVNEREFIAAVNTAAEESVIEATEQIMIHSVMELRDTAARSIMRPWSMVKSVDATSTVSEALTVALSERFTRLPVTVTLVDGELDVVGVVNVRDLVGAERDNRGAEAIKGVMRPITVVPESRTVDSLMREMQKTHNHMMIVADEYGRLVGAVTLEDCLEELVGEISDEHDDVKNETRRLEDGSYLFEGGVTLDDFEAETGIVINDPDNETLAGYVFSKLGRVAKVGDRVTSSGVHIKVESVDGIRVSSLRVTIRGVESAP